MPYSTVEVLGSTTSSGTRHLQLRVSAPAKSPDSEALIRASRPIIVVTANGTHLDLVGHSLPADQVYLHGRHAGGAVLAMAVPAGSVSMVV